MNKLKNTKSASIILTRVAMILIISLFSLLSSSAQTMRETFTAMPDSLLPTLTKNNRLDLMDFMDAKMKATVTNKLGGESTMTFLSDDSLCIRMNDALTVEMKTLKADTTTIINVKRIYHAMGDGKQAVLTHHEARTWRQLSPAAVVESTIQEPAKKIFSQDPTAP